MKQSQLIKELSKLDIDDLFKVIQQASSTNKGSVDNIPKRKWNSLSKAYSKLTRKTVTVPFELKGTVEVVIVWQDAETCVEYHDAIFEKNTLKGEDRILEELGYACEGSSKVTKARTSLDAKIEKFIKRAAVLAKEHDISSDDVFDKLQRENDD